MIWEASTPKLHFLMQSLFLLTEGTEGIPLISAVKWQKQADLCKFKTSSAYKASSRPPGNTYQSLSQKQWQQIGSRAKEINGPVGKDPAKSAREPEYRFPGPTQKARYKQMNTPLGNIISLRGRQQGKKKHVQNPIYSMSPISQLSFAHYCCMLLLWKTC